MTNAEKYLEDAYTTIGKITYVKQTDAREYARLKSQEDNAELVEALMLALRHGIREDENNEDHDFVVQKINEVIARHTPKG